MLLPIPPLLRRPSRRPKRQADPPPPPTTVIVVVSRLGPFRYCWQFNQSFDDNVGPWTPADFAGLTIDGTAPTYIDEVAGNDGTLILNYPVDHATAYHVAQTPAVLIFANGATAIVPATGPVLP